MSSSNPSDEDPAEKALDAIVDATPVLTVPEMTEETLYRFIEDVAQKIYPPETLARRYGFSSAPIMIEFIAANPELRRRIKVRRAIWESDDSVDTRIRKYAGHSVLEAMPATAHMMVDPLIPHATRLDALKAHSRMAGVDGLPPVARDGSSNSGGTPFNLNIHFSSGQKIDLSNTKLTADLPAIEGITVAAAEEPGADEDA